MSKLTLNLFVIFITIIIYSHEIKAQCNQTSYGNNQWYAFVYDDKNLSSFFGCYIENEIFNQDFGNRTWFWVDNGGWLITSDFSVRYKMRSSKEGCYVADMSGDDGIRLKVDGKWVFSAWVDQGTTTYSNILMNLNGNSTLDFEYYENGGGNVVRFQNFRKLNEITNGKSQEVCSGEIPALLVGTEDLRQSRKSRNTPDYEISRSTSYLWEESIDGGAWRVAPGQSNQKNYQPQARINNSSSNVEVRYRRVVNYSQTLPGVQVNKNIIKSYTDRTAIATIVVKNNIKTIGNISGQKILNPLDNGVKYSIPVIAGATSYEWRVPTGASIVSGINTNRISVNFSANAVSGPISVRARNTCGSGNWINYPIVVNNIPVVSLSVSPDRINENMGSSRVTAQLNRTSTSDVTVHLKVSGVASKSDYSINPKQIIIPKGSISAYVNLFAVDDNKNEVNETIDIEIESVVNGIENGTQRRVITIIDDDAPSPDPIQVDRKSPEKNYTEDELVEKVLVTGCLTADEVKFSGDSRFGIGYFNAGTSDFPLSSGIIMATGKVRTAEGPNNSPSSGSGIRSANKNDPDVKRLTKWKRAEDVQILEFDFIPAGDMLEFRYIFASEEYHEFACDNFNDVFGFILSGPGIDGPYRNKGKNIALIPNTNKNVSINNVNNQTCGDPTYYIHKNRAKDIQYDGQTTILTARHKVESCKKYHIRLIISDVGDNAYDSAVFIEAESFKSNEVNITNNIGVHNDVDVMYEGCSGSFIKFTRDEDVDTDLTFKLTISSDEAVNGVDYQYVDEYGNKIGDGKIPESVTMRAGQKEVVYHYKALADSKIEGNEKMQISFLKSCPCSPPEYYQKVITIVDVPEIKASPTSLVSCQGASPVATITVNMQDGQDPGNYKFSLDGGVFQDDNVFTLTNPVVGSKHIITVRDKFACQSMDFETTIPPVTEVEANAGGDQSICAGQHTQLEGSGGIYYKWTSSPSNGVNYLSDVNIPNPTVRADIPPNTYRFFLTVKESNSATASCVDTDEMTLTVKENIRFTISSDKMDYCSGETIRLSSNVINPTSGDVYKWEPIADVANSTSKNTTAKFVTTSLMAKDFSLEIIKANGCRHKEYISGIVINPEPNIDLDEGASNLCASGNDGQITIKVTGGTPDGTSPFYIYKWLHDSTLKTNSASNLTPKNYTVEVTDAKNCKAIFSAEVTKVPNPSRIFFD